MLTHYNITNNGFLTGEHMKFTAADKLCCCVPLFHCCLLYTSILNPEQAQYYFLSGFTAKLAGTERGITEPTPTFSACRCV